jgi:hypothetical protein
MQKRSPVPLYLHERERRKDERRKAQDDVQDPEEENKTDYNLSHETRAILRKTFSHHISHDGTRPLFSFAGPHTLQSRSPLAVG